MWPFRTHYTVWNTSWEVPEVCRCASASGTGTYLHLTLALYTQNLRTNNSKSLSCALEFWTNYLKRSKETLFKGFEDWQWQEKSREKKRMQNSSRKMESELVLIPNGMSGLSSLGAGTWAKLPLMELLSSELENLVKMKVPSLNSVVWEKKKTFSVAAVRRRQCAGPQDVGVITLPTDAV